VSTPASLRRLAQRLLPLFDLTDPEAAAPAAIRKLCARARTPAGNVAALCLPVGALAIAKPDLAGSAVPLAGLVNFPDGTGAPDAVSAELAAALAAGAEEIELVLPYRAVIAGDAAAATALVRNARAACGRKVLLKAVLETGRLGTAALIRAAAEAAIAGGADFLVTSSGFAEPGASAEAAATMLAVIAEARVRRRWVGFKAHGGIRTLSDAQPYLALYDRVLGEGAASAANFRIGGDALLNDVLLALGQRIEE
jgi:deoxyribose-phosphate aldolase